MARTQVNDCDILIKMIKSESINFDMGYLKHILFKSLVKDADKFPNISLSDLQLFGIDSAKKVYILEEEYPPIYKHKCLVGLFYYNKHKVIKIPPIKFSQIKMGKQYEYYIVPDPNNNIYLMGDLPLLTNETIEIHNLLYDWTQGYDVNNFKVGDKLLTKLLKCNISEEFRRCYKTLYRGFTFSPPALKKLQEGKTVRLQKRIFSSWSETKEEAKEFAGHVILEYQPKNEVVININLFEREVFKSIQFYPNSYENEIILLNSPEMLTVHPHQVVEGIESLIPIKGKKKSKKNKIIPTINLDSSVNNFYPKYRNIT